MSDFISSNFAIHIHGALSLTNDHVHRGSRVGVDLGGGLNNGKVVDGVDALVLVPANV